MLAKTDTSAMPREGDPGEPEKDQLYHEDGAAKQHQCRLETELDRIQIVGERKEGTSSVFEDGQPHDRRDLCDALRVEEEEEYRRGRPGNA